MSVFENPRISANILTSLANGLVGIRSVSKIYQNKKFDIIHSRMRKNKMRVYRTPGH